MYSMLLTCRCWFLWWKTCLAFWHYLTQVPVCHWRISQTRERGKIFSTRFIFLFVCSTFLWWKTCLAFWHYLTQVPVCHWRISQTRERGKIFSTRFIFLFVCSTFLSPPPPTHTQSSGWGYCLAVRPCVCVLFPDDISEAVSQIVFILQTHIP